mgnify:CR=1 FL=1
MKRIMILSTLLSAWHGGYAQQPAEVPDSLDAGVLNLSLIHISEPTRPY